MRTGVRRRALDSEVERIRSPSGAGREGMRRASPAPTDVSVAHQKGDAKMVPRERPGEAPPGPVPRGPDGYFTTWIPSTWKLPVPPSGASVRPHTWVLPKPSFGAPAGCQSARRVKEVQGMLT